MMAGRPHHRGDGGVARHNRDRYDDRGGKGKGKGGGKGYRDDRDRGKGGGKNGGGKGTGRSAHGDGSPTNKIFIGGLPFNCHVEEKFEKYFGYLARCEGIFCTTTLKNSKNRTKINQNAGKMLSKFENRALKTLFEI